MPPRRADPVQPAQAVEPAQEPVRFAIAPALANGDIIDFTTPGGAKLFKTGTDALASQFDCTAVDLQLFLDQLRDKVAIFNWTEILQVPDDNDVPKDLIDHYGELSYETVKAHAETYVHEDSQRAQDSFMLFNCIMNSMTDSGQKGVRNRGMVTPFTIRGRGSGALLLKVVVMVSHVDTRSTVTAVRTKLSSLDQAMRDKESDVQQFNDYVLSLVPQLHSRGEQTQDLLVNLFKGYKACRDAELVEYIKKKEDIYEEGGEVEYNQLMDWAVNKFKTRKEAGSWCQRTNEEETIIALQAQVQDLIKSSKADGRSPREQPKGSQRRLERRTRTNGMPRSQPGCLLHPRMGIHNPRQWMGRNIIGVQPTKHGPATNHLSAKG